MKAKPPANFYFPRELLLIEIDRRCGFTDCAAKNLIGLTKSEAIGYRGFECSHCEQWNDDTLKQGEVPDSWTSEYSN